MSNYEGIRTEDYRYNLPQERIARYPLDERESSKLLVWSDGRISDDTFRNIGKYLPGDSTLAFNNTRVIRSRLIFRKSTGARIEIFCLEPYDPAGYEQSLSATSTVTWRCIVGNLRKWKGEPLRMESGAAAGSPDLFATRVGSDGGDQLISFRWSNNSITFSEILEMAGKVPVPPYLERDDEPVDALRYQTVYSRHNGSVAAPTAGLHFTGSLISELNEQGIGMLETTLHVGADTFVPVKSDTIGGHEMHAEHFSVRREVLKRIAEESIVAVGTTSVRTLESLYHLGAGVASGRAEAGSRLHLSQWEPYNNLPEVPVREAMEALSEWCDRNGVDSVEGSTSVIIVPGYRFRIVKGLITNYHMPASTLLLLVSALVGDQWRRIYDHALDKGYRFLSYGDSSLLLPGPK